MTAPWIALREIRRNFLRSFLTLLGVALGVAAVVTLLTIGQGATDSILADVSSMGDRLLMVTPGTRQRGPAQSTATPFDNRDLEAIAAEVGPRGVVAPSGMSSQRVVRGSTNRSVGITGTTAAWFGIRDYTLTEGRLFTESEEQSGRAVCVVGDTTAQALFGSAPVVGEAIRVGKLNCTVIGRLAKKGGSSMGGDQDEIVVIPFRTLQRRLMGNDNVSQIFVHVGAEASLESVKGQVERLLAERRRIRPDQDPDFTVMDLREIVTMVENTTLALKAFLVAVGSIALVVGGVGILNMMLVSVTERTREIGVRAALGATPGDLRAQFLFEAVFLATFGGAMGLVGGASLAGVVCAIAGLPFSVSPWVVVLAFGVCATIGVVAGIWPANRAASVDPIAAMRQE